MMSQETSFLKSEVDDLRSALTTVTEALILVQEFIEEEIGEMSYFRDSGSYNKLSEMFNKLRVPRTLQLASPRMKTSAKLGNRNFQLVDINKRLDFNQEITRNFELLGEADEEQIEVDVDFDEEDRSTDEITISKVQSIHPALVSENFSPAESYHLQSLITFKAPVATTGLMEKVKQEQQGHQQYWQSRPILPTMDPPNISNNRFNRRNPSILKSTQQEQRIPMNLVTAPASSTGILESRPIRKPSVKSQKGKRGKAKREVQKEKAKVVGRGISKKDKTIKSSEKGKPTKAVKAIDTGKAKCGKPTLKENLAKNKATTSSKPAKRPRSNSFKCPVCSKGYSSKGVMCRHMKEAHQTEPQFSCFYCTLKFRTGPMRLDHMHKIHPTDFKSVICPYCNRKSTSATGKRNHMMLCARKHQASMQQDTLQQRETERYSPKASSSGLSTVSH